MRRGVLSEIGIATRYAILTEAHADGRVTDASYRAEADKLTARLRKRVAKKSPQVRK